jgi:hypothetical protein
MDGAVGGCWVTSSGEPRAITSNRWRSMFFRPSYLVVELLIENEPLIDCEQPVIKNTLTHHVPPRFQNWKDFISFF